MLLCAVLMLVFALFGPVDHDEGQYVGAVAMMRHSLPYRDFAYLQTPLQPLLFAPLAWIAEGWLFLTLRVTNALLATGATACIWLAAKRAGASDRAAVIAAITLLSSHALLFAGSVARNDALPLLLTTAGLAAVLDVVRNSRGLSSALLAGVLLGAAASAKISYGLPAAAAGLFALLHWRSLGAGTVCALAVGGVLGGLPTLWLMLLAPEAAWFGIIEYSLKAPIEWRTLNGQAFMFDWPLSLVRLLRYLVQGCGLIALVAVLLIATRRRTITERLLDLMIVAGLLAAWLPRPIYVQYLGPLLPALFIRFALLTDASFWRTHFVGRALIPAGLLAGVAQSIIATAPNILANTSPILAITDDAHALSRIVAAARISGTIATLSPERAVDGRLPIDHRFVTGPFLMRTRNVLTADQARAFHAATSTTLMADLNAAPPAAILVGGERQASSAFPRGLDQPLIEWAESHSYHPVILPSGMSRVFLRPSSTVPLL